MAVIALLVPLLQPVVAVGRKMAPLAALLAALAAGVLTSVVE
jgi:hypothetical protein